MPRDEVRKGWLVSAAVSAAIMAGAALGVLRWGKTHHASSPLESGRAAYDQRDWLAAERFARDQLRNNRADPDALRLLSRALFRQSRDEIATTISGKVNRETMTAEDYFLVGQSSVRSQDVELAIQFWRKAVGLDPNHLESRIALEQVYFRLDRLSEAGKEAKALLAQPGRKSLAELMRGQICVQLSDAAGASEALTRALRRPDEWAFIVDPARARKLLARSLLQRSRSALARQQLLLITGGDRDPETSWLLSRCDLQQSMPSELAVSSQAVSYRKSNPLEPEPAPYVGEARCAGCHAQLYREQHLSRHARTFSRVNQLSQVAVPEKPLPDPGNPRVSHAFHKSAEGVEVRTRTGGTEYETIVDYAFGSGKRGMTLVGHEPHGQTLECRLSFYPDLVGWDVTSGQSLEPDLAPASYAGKSLSVDELRNCMECHVTNRHSIVTRGSSKSTDRAIGCETCHGPGGNHVSAVLIQDSVSKTNVDLAIARPGLASGSDVIGLCARCHSPRKNVPKFDPQSPSSIRFQGITLTQSRCYVESDMKFDCVTCHNPHRDAEPSLTWYESRCLQCHARDSAPVNDRGEPAKDHPRACPVQPATGCTACHMPKLETPMAHTTFTDHYIRVHRESELKPKKRL